MNKELEEAIKYFKGYTDYTKNRAMEEYKCECKNIQYAKDLEKRAKIFENILNYIENSISKEVIEEKIEELNEGIKRDMINYDKVKDESWKMAIHRSITQKIETKKVLQELLEEK